MWQSPPKNSSASLKTVFDRLPLISSC